MARFEKHIEQLNNKGSFQRKFGIKIASAGVAPIPVVLLLFHKKMKLKYSDFWFICYILSKRHDREWSHFSLKKITRESGICQDTLHKIKNRLVKKGFLRIIPRRENPKGKGRHTYDLSGLFYILRMYVDNNKEVLLKSNEWSKKDSLDYAFIEDIEKEKFSEKQRDDDS
jgi:DNA-binding MarR family transcriptional regulator